MATYQFLGETNALPYGVHGHVVLKRFIDFADLVSNPQKLATAADPTVPLSAFAGLISADVLQVFHVPAGFVVKAAGFYFEAIDGTEPTCKFQLGDGDSAAGYAAATVGTAGTAWQTVLTDAYGSSAMESRIYLAADTIDITMSVEDTVDAKIHVYVMGFLAFNLLGADV